MRKVLPLMLLLGLSACGASRWEKAGVDAETAKRDGAECRKAARDQAWRYYSNPPPQPFSGALDSTIYSGMRAGSGNMWQEHTTETGRYAMESQLNATCMRKRGYDWVPVPQAR